ncbi:hypothetical protein [Micromonospora sp. CPCC 206061]|uniref:hypothetical protein n=1 Tax=Micromonospora sp. CPCC 206061 TaxID=3122410 RepID=UPI002FF3E88E
MDQNEQETFQRLLHLLEQIEPWVERCSGDKPGFSRLGAGSSLRGDDDRVHPYETSHAVWSALSHAVDHLHAVRSMLRDAQVIHNYASYTLLRAAIENAAVAVWLLAPASRSERITRRLRHAAADIKGGEEVKELVGHHGPRSKRERVSEIRSLAAKAAINVDRASAPASFRGIVQAAGEKTDLGGRITRLLWHMGSGIAHGDLWATVSVGEAVEMPGAPAGMTHMRVSAGVNGIFMMTLAAILLAKKGWDLYELRALGIR